MRRFQFVIFLFSIIFTGYAQIGINTDSPTTLLDVVSSSATTTGKAFIITNSDNTETFQVRNDGYIGIGVPNPLVKLDLRSASLAAENALGIGYTSQTAANAGAGAIRYNDTEQTLEYSDGTDWLRLQANPDRAMVIAQNSSGQTAYPASGTALVTNIVNWTSIYDRTNSFNASTGYFTAPRDGIYSISVTGVFSNTNMNAGGQYELILASGNNEYLKSTVPFLSPVVNLNITNVNKTVYYLAAGETLHVRAYFYALPGGVTMSTDGSLNVLTIAEM
ncbi:hypothetical protein [Dysgonomonas macrotermitis]|uniref:C1q domain-containing protein n=1 Tax=Dysgonomonas macrotermitis TaxID=1346286 RepID=A0A1M5CGR1_9BACT|nr:hypothetical protein [Dysgonomonas macrotermitis]SHF53787.1 hypothetical protein SAMN05444362_107161 [Dysgonomonas macrotermitis]